MIDKKAAPPPLGTVREVRPQEINDILRTLNGLQRDLSEPQPAKIVGLRLVDFPQTGAGLLPGQCFLEDDGTIRAVMPGRAYAPSVQMLLALGDVEVTVV